MKKHNPFVEDVEKLYMEASNGNDEAFKFLIGFNNYCHGIDDIVDGEVKDSEGIVAIFFTAAVIFHNNYWIKNSKHLLPVLILITNDYVDSNNEKEKLRDMLRFCGNNMIKIVAFIEGGYELMRQVSPKLNALSYREHHDEITLEPR